MKVDRDVIRARSQAPDERGFRAEPARPARSRGDDHLVDVRVVRHDRRRRRFNEVADVGVREALSEGSNRRRREDHVADLSEPDEQKPRDAGRRRRYG